MIFGILFLVYVCFVLFCVDDDDDGDDDDGDDDDDDDVVVVVVHCLSVKADFPFNPQELAKEFKAKAPNVADAG